MRRYTDTYNAALQAGAKPLILAYVTTDTATRCFGKETPQEAHIDTSLSVFDSSARVLTFGDFTQRLATQSELVLLSLIQEEMSTYTLTCDNVDYYFSIMSGQERFLGGQLVLKQGFEYPGFLFSDFQPLFQGYITNIKLTLQECQITATQTAENVPPDSPTIDTSNIYALRNAGSTFIAASSTFSYAVAAPSFYQDDDWTFTADFVRDTTGVQDILFQITNNKYGEDRLQIGIDDHDHLFVRFTDNVDSSIPKYSKATADFTLSASAHRISITANTTDGTFTFSDNDGNQTIVSFIYVWSVASSFGSAGSGDGQFSNPQGLTIDVYGNIFVGDSFNNRVQKFNSAGVYQSQFGTSGTGDGEFDEPEGVGIDANDNIFVCDRLNHRVQKFNSAGVYQSQFGTSGTGDGEFDEPRDIAMVSSGNMYITDWGNHRVQVFNSAGVYQFQFGSFGSGDGEMNGPEGITFDTLGNVLVVDTLNSRVQAFNSGGSYLYQFGTYGTGEGEFYAPVNIVLSQGVLFVTDYQLNRVEEFDGVGHYRSYFIGNFNQPNGIAANVGGDIFVLERANNRVQKFTKGLSILFDRTDTSPTSTDDVIVGPEFDGDITTMGFQNPDNDRFRLVNTNSGGLVFPDIIGDNDITVDDGTWVDVGDIVQYTDPITTEYPISATDEIILPTAGRYSFPGDNQQNVILPLPYGNLIRNSDEGVWVCPCIDTVSFVYCVAGWPIQSVANGNTISVFIDGEPVIGDWTFDESNDFQSQGAIAILTFTTDPGGTISVRCNGKWVSGELLTNPVDIISDFIDYAAGLLGNLTWETDATSFAEGAAFCDENYFEAAGIILSNNTLGYWLKSILASFMGSFTFTDVGEIALKFLPMVYSENIVANLEEYEGIQITHQELLENVVQTLTTDYAVSYAKVDRRYKNNAMTSYFRTLTEESTEKNIGGKTVMLTFDWNRKTSSVETIHEVLFALYAKPQQSITYQGQDFKFLPLDLLDQVSATLLLIRDNDGNPIEDKIYDLREKIINLDDFTSKLQLESLNPLASVSPNLGSRVYIGISPIFIGSSPVYIGD